MQQTVSGLPALFRTAEAFPEQQVREALTGASEPIVVRVFGDDPDVLSSTAEAVREAITGIEGLVDPRVERATEEPTVEIEVDLAAANRFGIKPGDVRRAAATLLSGIQVGSLFEEQKVFEVVVWGTPEIRENLEDVRELLIDTPSGGHVRLSEVADVRVVANPVVIERASVSRYLDVVAGIDGRSVGAAASDVERRLEQVAFPFEYHAELLRDFEERRDTATRMIGIGVAGAIGIFLLLQAALGSWRLATLAALMLPVSVVGGVLAAAAAGFELSLGVLIGLLAVFGIAVRTIVLLLSRYEDLRENEGEQFGPELVMRGAWERGGPILMTATAAGLALLTLIVAGGHRAGFEILHPLAVVALGGLITSTLVSLLVVPALYLRFARRTEHERAAGHGPAATLDGSSDGNVDGHSDGVVDGRADGRAARLPQVRGALRPTEKASGPDS